MSTQVFVALLLLPNKTNFVCAIRSVWTSKTRSDCSTGRVPPQMARLDRCLTGKVPPQTVRFVHCPLAGNMLALQMACFD